VVAEEDLADGDVGAAEAESEQFALGCGGSPKRGFSRARRRTAGLAFEDAELVAEGEDLSAESGVGVTSDDQDLDQEADDGVRGSRTRSASIAETPRSADVRVAAR